MDETLHKRIDDLIKGNDVILFMKGSPQMPQCGFSARVVDVLDDVGVQYATFNILSDAEMRQGVKDYANWPTFPQLYVKGEFIGGCDIVTEMYANGELQALFKQG
ncbi:Grx4 family monothiol glutaredoxin [Myxococcota bacterium]|jgi:monothiol glutaredoxin|nr:Grx4 family monothiol glutaredoxin [Myxococcota bacterium]